jgi:small subunit ribosomal protein S16
MSVKIRLARFGAKKQAHYRIVVTDSRVKRDGRFIEQVGTYDPKKVDDKVQLQHDRVREWLNQGAQPSQTVQSILEHAGILGRGAVAAPAPAATE